MKKLFIFVTIIALGTCFFLKYGRAKNSFKKKLYSSVSDNGVYPQFCHRAARDEQLFAKFKTEPIYNLMQEYTSYEEGKKYLEIIQKQTEDLLSSQNLEKFRKNDLIGSPKMFVFEPWGLFSPSTLRYIKVASDLRRNFGNLEGMRVVEIGGGYGGQCKILSDLFHFSSYTIVDISASLELAKKYLTLSGLSQITYLTPEQLPNECNCDLVISNYGFTESTARLQKQYLDKIFCHAKRGYVTCNFFPKHFRVRPLEKEMLLKKIESIRKNHEILQEEPLTGRDNFILVWK